MRAASFLGVVGLAGLEDAVNLVEEFAHDGDDDLLGLLAVGEEPLGEGFEQGVVDPRGHGGHEEAAPQLGGADLGDGCAGFSGGAAGVVLGREAGPGGELARVVELARLGEFGEDGLSRDFTDAGDGSDQFASPGKFWDSRGDFRDLHPQCLDLFLLIFNDSPEGGGDGFVGASLEGGLEPCCGLSERVGAAAQGGDLLLWKAPGLPGAQVSVLGLEEGGDEFGIGGVALVAPQFLHAEGFDALGIDEVEGGDARVVEGFGDQVAVVAGLLKAGAELRGRGGFQYPFEEEGDACRGVVETGGAWLARGDDVAEEVFLADVDAEEKARRGGGVCGSFHGAFGCP